MRRPKKNAKYNRQQIISCRSLTGNYCYSQALIVIIIVPKLSYPLFNHFVRPNLYNSFLSCTQLILFSSDKQFVRRIGQHQVDMKFKQAVFFF